MVTVHIHKVYVTGLVGDAATVGEMGSLGLVGGGKDTLGLESIEGIGVFSHSGNHLCIVIESRDNLVDVTKRLHLVAEGGEVTANGPLPVLVIDRSHGQREFHPLRVDFSIIIIIGGGAENR